MLMENDQVVGFKRVKPVTTPSPNLSESKEAKMMFEFFKKVAGEDEEVDWNELKQVLDYYTRKEDTANANINGFGATSNQQQPENNNVLTTIMGLLCGTFCKDTPLNDVVPISTFESKNKGFSKDVCRSMIAMLDVDRTGKLNFQEFERLWGIIRTWKAIFNKFDKNESGSLSGFELREALNSAGYELNNHTLNILMQRYGNKSGVIEFDDFIMCAVKLKVMIELFNQTRKPDSETVTFSLEDWIETTLYA